MPGLDANTLKIVLRGTQAGDQTWSTAFWATVASGSAITGTNIGPLAVAIEAGPLNTFATFCKNHIWSSITTYEGATVYYYPDGSIHAEYVGIADATSIAGSETPYQPALLSMVQSLRTPLSGRSYRGRMYVPASGVGVNSTAQWPDDIIGDMATATAAMLSTFNTADYSAHGLAGQGACIASFTTGGVVPITTVEVDSKPDTQHRRQDKLLALFRETAAVSAGS
jgi:hypothetical protein